MNNLLKISAALLLLLFLSCKGNQNSSQNNQPDSTSMKTDTTMHATTYTCPMHPEIVSDTAGVCPKCGMDLEPKS